MKKLGKFKVIQSKTKIHKVDLNYLKVGVNEVGNHFIKLNAQRQIEYVIDNICDHRGGKLIKKGNKAICPLHKWELNLNTLQYNVPSVCKTPKDYLLEEDKYINLAQSERSLSNPFKPKKLGKVNIRWLNHATVYIECNGISLITDPWLFGPSFMTGWWLENPSPVDAIDLLKKADYVFLSHNHPDHLHAETLSILPKSTQFIIPPFKTKSVEKYLLALGFKNFMPLAFTSIFELAEGVQVSILNSGDFKDDAGIYICANGYEMVLVVDANFLNSYVLPKGIDLLMTAFASGGSGFPLCYDNYSEEEKTKILERHKKTTRIEVSQYIENTKPKYYMPYAGMFKTASIRDNYITQQNIQNTADDYINLCAELKVELVLPFSNQILHLENGQLYKAQLDCAYLKEEDTQFYIDKLKEEYPYDALKIIEYLQKSNYHGQQIVQVLPTDDYFEKIVAPIVYADFQQQIFKQIEFQGLIMEKKGLSVMQIRVRPEVMMCVVENKLPWEDISFGFQLRIERNPNEWSSDFWYHFTNVYIGGKDFRYSSFCGACTTIDHNPVWIV